MGRLWTRAPRFRKVFRQLIAAALGLLLAGTAFAQVPHLGSKRGQRPAAGLHQHDRARSLVGSNRGVRPDLRLRREGDRSSGSQAFSLELAWPLQPSISWPGSFRSRAGWVLTI